jgi:beta-lactam-binding protein with PASTA domain
MRLFFRMLILALVLVTVALVSALTAMRFAIHGREVAIPRVIGMTPAEAERAASGAGVEIVVERQFYSADVPEGRIMSQAPQAGVKVRRGWAVRVAQSLGPQRVAIPDVTNQSVRVAELNVRRRGLDLGSVAQINLPDAAADQVVSQSPPANAKGVAAPKISLLVSRGPEPAAFAMPNFVGQPLGSVTLVLQDAGIKLGKVTVVPVALPADVQTEPPASIPAGAASMIVTQSPAAGQKVVAGSAVNFEVR